MPGSNERALEKAKILPADALILDLEEALAPADLLAVCDAARDAILVSKVTYPGDIIGVAKILQGVHAPEKIRLWAMMETPMAILNARSIAATAVYLKNRLDCLVMGTNDLLKESRAQRRLREPCPQAITRGLATGARYGKDPRVLGRPAHRQSASWQLSRRHHQIRGAASRA